MKLAAIRKEVTALVKAKKYRHGLRFYATNLDRGRWFMASQHLHLHTLDVLAALHPYLLGNSLKHVDAYQLRLVLASLGKEVVLMAKLAKVYVPPIAKKLPGSGTVTFNVLRLVELSGEILLYSTGMIDNPPLLPESETKEAQVDAMLSQYGAERGLAINALEEFITVYFGLVLALTEKPVSDLFVEASS